MIHRNPLPGGWHSSLWFFLTVQGSGWFSMDRTLALALARVATRDPASKIFSARPEHDHDCLLQKEKAQRTEVARRVAKGLHIHEWILSRNYPKQLVRKGKWRPKLGNRFTVKSSIRIRYAWCSKEEGRWKLKWKENALVLKATWTKLLFRVAGIHGTAAASNKDEDATKIPVIGSHVRVPPKNQH